MLERLKLSAEKMEALADRLDVLFASPEPPDFDLLASLRWDIANLAMRHMSMIDRFVLAHLASDERAHVRATVESFRHDCIVRIRQYAEHAKRWPADRVQRDWEGFRRHAAEQSVKLRSILAAMRGTIFPMACPVKSQEPRALSLNWASEGSAVKASVIPSRAAEMTKADQSDARWH